MFDTKLKSSPLKSKLNHTLHVFTTQMTTVMGRSVHFALQMQLAN